MTTDSSATRKLTRAIATAQPSNIPTPVMRHALRTLVNFVGCAAGGSQHEMVERTEKAMLPQSGPGESCVIGRATRTAAVTAALLNGIAGAVNAFDDTHAEAIIHPGPPVAAALVAISGGMGKPITGKAFLLAYAWGLELACRLSKATSVAPAEGAMGWSQTGIAAPAGAAAACAKLLGLTEQEIGWAIGIAASQSSGLRVAHGSMAMHLAPAQAAATGAQAALLAQAGVTGPETALEGRYGFLELFARRASMDHLIAGIGSHFELLSNTFKAYPCGIVIHAVIDACLALRAKGGFVIEDIRELRMTVPPATKALTDKPQPDGVFAAQVSSQHWAAVSLLHGAAGIAQGQPSVIEDPEIIRLRGLCRITELPEMAADAAEVTLLLADGRIIHQRIDHYLGSLANPLGEDGLSRKFMAQAVPVIGDDAAMTLLDRCWGLPENTDVRHIWSGTP